MRQAASVIHLQALMLIALCGGLPSVQAQTPELLSRTGHSLGLALFQHRYEEPGYMTLKSRPWGVDYAYTQALESPWPRSDENWFVRFELGHARGKADYSSPLSGSMAGKVDRHWMAKAVAGKDLVLGGDVWSPYAGLALRHQFNDLRGTSSTGVPGYRRENNQRVAVLGVTHKTALSGQAQLHSTVEYLHLLRGTQQARQTDASPLLSDLSLRQRQGHGLRAQLMHHADRWAFGPTLGYWRIAASDTAGNSPAFEPRNKTYELGLKASYSF